MGPHVFLRTQAIQFVDDTVIISEAHPTMLKVISRILSIYAELSRLKINRSKSEFIPIALPQHMVQAVMTILACLPTRLPVKYLGLPLTIRKPRKIHFQPMLQIVRNKIERWKANLLSYGERITLVKSVLSAIPLHFMQALRMPKGVVRHIDRMRRSFLWRRTQECKGINCLANWEVTCALKCNGGLGILDLDHQNEALLLKWVWWIQHHPEGQWAQTLNQLYGITDEINMTQRASESFFLKDLAAPAPFYTSSVRLQAGQQARVWHWSANAIFTVSSAYLALHNTGIQSAYHLVLWKLKVPMKVKIFIWLMLLDKTLTRENLIIRECQVNIRCKLYNSLSVEMISHIMWSCPFMKRFWRGLCAQINILRRVENNIENAWLEGRMTLQGTERKRWDMAWGERCWTMWKERNRRTFSYTTKTLSILINETTTNLHNWEHFV